MQILQVNTIDNRGGAGRIAWMLFEAYRTQGHASWLAVGERRSGDPDVVQIPPHGPGWWSRGWSSLSSAAGGWRGRLPGAGRAEQLCRWMADPRHAADWWRGREDFNFPGAWRLLALPPSRPDIVHCHNLHGGYFDLRALPSVSEQAPVVLTLHDAWLLSGHCAYSYDCDRWQAGCGQCPDLTIYPAIRRDATDENWTRKREIYGRCRLSVATPSRWLMHQVERSMLAPAMVDARVIPNGVDLSIFHPADKVAARNAVGLNRQAQVVLFVADYGRRNVQKDFQTASAAVAEVAGQGHGREVQFVVLGGEAPGERRGAVEYRFIPYQHDPRVVASYYRAADLYLHAARADTFPNSVLEALACGTPVVATHVGGIPEQITPLAGIGGGGGFGADEATGVLVPPGDVSAMAEGVKVLLGEEALRAQLSQNASDLAIRKFDQTLQVQAYLQWYQSILDRNGRGALLRPRAAASERR